MDPIYLVVLIGIVGGLVKSLLGYIPSSDGFSWVRFMKTLGLAAVAGGAVVFFTKINGVENVVLTTSEYVEAFFISIGASGLANSAKKAGTGKKIT